MMTIRKFKIKVATCFLTCLLACSACSDYLNIVPDDIATIDNAFAMRSEAEKYLYTCYSYMVQDGLTFHDNDNFPQEDPTILGGDEIWTSIEVLSGAQIDRYTLQIARGYQNASNPLCNKWQLLYQGIRDCNTFIENIDRVPDMTQNEKNRWEAEVKTLKAHHYFWLVRMYGPVPLFKENLPINANPDEVKVPRSPVDDCFAYIVELLDEAIPNLPLSITNIAGENGRITRTIAASLKAKALVFAASPLFNGNAQFATLKNHDGTPLFNATSDDSKWERAVTACREAVKMCEDPAAKVALYHYGIDDTADEIKQELTIRGTFNNKWNSEIIWANTQTPWWVSLINQRETQPNLDNKSSMVAGYQPPIKIAEMFYTKNGVPIEEDKDWKNIDPFAYRTGTGAGDEKFYIKRDYTTIQLHFDREPRYYASLGFDGGLWYGQGVYGYNPDEYLWVNAKNGSIQGYKLGTGGTVTGYYVKKWVNYESVQDASNQYNPQTYPWPILRLSDLYLLYAEAINEAEGPNGANSAEMFKYIDLVRIKDGLEGVKESWDKYVGIAKYSTQDGMRKIIQRERLIELAFEGQRFWDLRRWMTAPAEYAKGIYAWRVKESEMERFFQPLLLEEQKFGIRDYFWPIKTEMLEVNTNLVQNIGW
jgi:hypothetical protein